MLEPSQVSATSQTPTELRHTNVLGRRASAGHGALEPVQFSATSHAPADERHTVADDWNASVGQAPAAPVQVSATSQMPADVRQVAPEARNAHADVQHDVEAPFEPPWSQDSFVSTIELPQIGSGATDQPAVTRSSSRILPLNVSG